MNVPRRSGPIDAEFDFGLKPGDRLECKKGFVFTSSISGIPPHVPDEVVVIKEYPRFILVEASFYRNRGESYRECINKASYINGDVVFRQIGKDE